MPPLAERLDGFARALLDPEQPVPAGLVGPDGRPSRRRFGVYRNNVVVGLTHTLKDAYPAVHRIVGAEFFQAMAHHYLVSELPCSPILLDYGAGFPAFISGFAPASILPYLADVARLERAWIEAYHAAEAEPIAPAAFAAIAPADLPALRLRFHPSLRLIDSRFPVLTIWQMNAAGGIPGSVDIDGGGEAVLIVRPDADVVVRSIPPGSFDFVQAVVVGKSMLAALQGALRADPGFDLAGTLHDLIQSGAAIGFDLEPMVGTA
ncbi:MULTISPECIES: DNA-binding domain-containing protein [unclassified Bradyrhizobium]|uniref:HvfC/BufC N-terminal domain-containing protein n=1 Tax=unclassified Bradyrhizobium TaxID=2631580 RepID=UPI002915EF86|nr:MULTISPECIES: DNA-binding domain-containing protein [unclassified Bradyrhizobium]